MTHLTRRLILAVALMTGITPAVGQVPNFPLTMPSDTFVGRIQPGSGPSSAVPISALLARVVPLAGLPNSSLNQTPAATIKGNPTGSIAFVQDFTLRGLANRNAPDANNDKLLIFDSAAGVFKYVLPGAIAAAATSGVSSIGGMTSGLACADVINCAGGTISTKFTQTGTGAVSVLLGSYLQTVVTPEQFGAACNGTGDDGPAIQRAINSNAGRVTVILSPTCVYRVVTGITINKKGVRIIGAGRYISTIDYEPTGAGTLFTVGDGITRLYGTQLRDFSIISADTTFLKVGFKVIDVSETILYGLSCSQTNLLGGSWQGGGGSTCLQTNGRDTTVFEKLILSAEQPIVLNLDPAIYLSTDHFLFRDLELVAAGFPCITATSGIVMTNTTFDGMQSWNLCTNGFFVNDTTSVLNWNNLSFNNVRSEQTPFNTGFSFFISVATGNRLIGLTISNSQLDGGMKGVFLRNVQNATIQNSDFTCSGAAAALDVNDTDDYLRLVNAHFESACTITNSSGNAMVLQWAASFPSTASLTIPADAIYGKSAVAPPMFANALGMPKIGGTGVAPGVGKLRLEVIAGTNAGTCRLIAYAGTSGSSFTVLDNIGAGC